MLGFLLVILLGAHWLAPPNAGAAERVRLALPAKSMGYLPLFVAIHRGFFRDENIDVDTIADSAVDWIDPDSNEELNGAEDAYYTNLPVPYQAANAWFSSASELLAVKGMTRELYVALFTTLHRPFGSLDAMR